jgi:hypothetical protein
MPMLMREDGKKVLGVCAPGYNRWIQYETPTALNVTSRFQSRSKVLRPSTNCSAIGERLLCQSLCAF